MNSLNNDDSELPDWCHNVLSEHGDAEGERLPIGIVTYGSLLHPDEAKTLFGLDKDDQVRVRVNGFQRRFNKKIAEHIYRETEPEKTAVLNIEQRRGEWFNGLLLGPVNETDFKQYAFREQEYELQKLDPANIEFYSSRVPTLLDELDALYTCLLEEESQLRQSLEPVPSYLDLCLEGASEHGEQFEVDFKRTTKVKDKRLEDFLAKE